MAILTHEQAAEVAGVTIRRLYQITDDEPDGPKRCKPGHFDCKEFGAWLAGRNGPDTFLAERTRLTKAQADKTELEVAELAGELVRTEEVSTAWGEKIASARARLLPFPSKIAQRIAPPERIAEVQALAQDVVYEALNELAGDGLPDRARSRQQAGQRDLDPAAPPDSKPVGRRKSKAVARVKRRAGKVAD